MQERTSLEDSLGGIGKVERELEDNIGMIELGEAENDAGVVAEAETALFDIVSALAQRANNKGLNTAPTVITPHLSLPICPDESPIN